MSTDQPRSLYLATEAEIKAGLTTDVYFERAVEIIRATGTDRPVRAEFTAKTLPHGADWGIFAGLDEVVAVLAGRRVDVRAVPEGSVFHPYEPVMEIRGSYLEFAGLETAILGLICQSSGVATKAARIRRLAGERVVASFGARRAHPAIAPVIERAAYVGGCDGVSVVKAARILGADPTGTMPHSLILLMGDTVEAALAYDRVLPASLPRIVLVDTFNDEKFEAVRVAEALGERLWGVRLDTPSSRRGDFRRIVQEVRWELDLRGFQHVRIIVSGGLDEVDIVALRDLVDAFGVGTSIASASTIDFAMDIVEIDGKPIAKRGKLSGAKELWRCPASAQDWVLPLGELPPDAECVDGDRPERMLRPLLQAGQLVAELPPARDVRAYVLTQLQTLPPPA
ncbi:MAG TPA: nicotinate phosphoribosyltransferase [Thermomicrobiaceae bacterium]|nr:nicotinate phosphoribosyltransferase [Thermomicrobiaceae bacterium]